ncbi:hypothetical protein [carnivorous sponge associated iridovirus]|nr:hypothetical protein [carnivorous sponge associated iridovirus]
MTMNMNANALISCIGSSLRGFFEFCEAQNGVKADELDTLFAQFFDDAEKAAASGATEGSDVAQAVKKPAKKAKKSPCSVSDSDSESYHVPTDIDSDSEVAKKVPKKTPKAVGKPKKKEISDHSDSEDDDDTLIKKPATKKPATKKPATKKAAAKKDVEKEVKKDARKPSGKGKDLKPRDEQTSIGSADLSKKKLPELKALAKERGLAVSGTKAQVIENILNYEKDQEGTSAEQPECEDDLNIEVKKPKTKQKLCEPATTKKYEIIQRHGLKMVEYNPLDGCFVLDANNVVVGWVHRDDDEIEDEDDGVDVRALDKYSCEMAKELGLKYEVPDNLDQ